MNDIGKMLIFIGLIIIIIGFLITVLGRLGLGRLPGDIIIQKKNFTFIFPLASSIVISIILTILMWIIFRIKH